MIISFIAFLISLVVRIIFDSLSDKFQPLKNFLPWLNYIVIAAAAIFVLFVLIELIFKIRARKGAAPLRATSSKSKPARSKKRKT